MVGEVSAGEVNIGWMAEDQADSGEHICGRYLRLLGWTEVSLSPEGEATKGKKEHT